MWDSLVAFLQSEGFRNACVFAALLVAIASILSARVIAKKKQTADMLFATRGDSELINGLRTIADLHDIPEQNIRAYAEKNKKADVITISIRYVLNHYENISVGIQSGIYDEKMLKTALWTIVNNLYKRTRPFIEQAREVQAKTAYQEFEWLACRWSQKPLKRKKIKIIQNNT